MNGHFAGPLRIGLLAASISVLIAACVVPEVDVPEILALGVDAPSACEGDVVNVRWKVAKWAGTDGGGMQLEMADPTLFDVPTPIALTKPNAGQPGTAPPITGIQTQDLPFTLRVWNNVDKDINETGKLEVVGSGALRMWPDESTQPILMSLTECTDLGGFSGARWNVKMEKAFFPDSLRVTALQNPTPFPLTITHTVDGAGVEPIATFMLPPNAQAPPFEPRPLHGEWLAEFDPPQDNEFLLCPPPTAWPSPEDFTLSLPKPGDPGYDADFENTANATDLDFPEPIPLDPPEGNNVWIPPQIALAAIISCES